MLQPQITITPAAEKFIRRMVRFSETPAGGFKLSVAPGGCSGYSSEFSVEAAPGAASAKWPSTVAPLPERREPPAAGRHDDGLCRDAAAVGPGLQQARCRGLRLLQPTAAAPQRPAEAAVSLSSIKRR
jgi:iron-sulfur cluster assembly protein